MEFMYGFMSGFKWKPRFRSSGFLSALAGAPRVGPLAGGAPSGGFFWDLHGTSTGGGKDLRDLKEALVAWAICGLLSASAVDCQPTGNAC